MLTESDTLLVHRSYVFVSMLPLPNTGWLMADWRFPHSQPVRTSFRCSLYLMLTDLDALPVHRPYAFRINTPFIWCWPSRTRYSFAGCTCFVFGSRFIWCWPCPIAHLQIVSALFHCSLHLMLTDSDAWCPQVVRALSNAYFIRCSLSRMLCSLAHRLYVFYFNARVVWCSSSWILQPFAGSMCFVSIFFLSDADHVLHVARLTACTCLF